MAAEVGRRLPIPSSDQDEALMGRAGISSIGIFYARLPPSPFHHLRFEARGRTSISIG